MRHARTRQQQFVIDPETGKRYPVPAGGAGEGEGEGEGGDGAGDGEEGAGDDDGSGEGDGDGDGDGEGDDDVLLGPAGEKALREMKRRARDAEKELRRMKAQKRESGDDGQEGDGESDPKKIREQVESEVRQQYARDRALDKVEARAARRFQNPDLARKLLADQADDFLDEKGNPDVEAIGEALDELLEDEPYLGIDAAQRRRFEGDGDGGTRNGGKAGQLTRDDLKRMGPDEIEQARVDGKLTDLLGSS